jgi:hypothetical protein
MAQFAPVHATETVLPGWDLLQTDPASTMFFGQSFEGVALGTFDFDSTIGVQNVGPTDTIIQRVGPATVPGPGNSTTVGTVVDAFQLRSVGAVSILGGPVGVYYLTLASARGGPVSLGTMTINFGPGGDPEGTFSSSFDLFVDVRFGSLAGPILGSSEISIPDSGSTPWTHDATGPIQIPGVNIDLNGSTSGNDFWIEGSVSKQTPNGSIGAYNAGASVADSGETVLLLGLALLVVGSIKTMPETISTFRRA